MRNRDKSLMLGGMVALFTAGGKARVIDCTIDSFCRTSVYELFGANVEPGEEVKPRTIWEESNFRTTIVSDPATFLENSTFLPHYAGDCALRHDIDEKLEEFREKHGNQFDRLFVVMEEYKFKCCAQHLNFSPFMLRTDPGRFQRALSVASRR